MAPDGAPRTCPPRDLLVVGGGPVGLAVAIAARGAGLEVLLCERQAAPVDKACGEGILPAGLAALARLGVALPAGAAFRGIRYRAGELVATADFPGGELGRGLRRTALHDALRRRAEELGAELRFGEAVEGVVAEAGGIALRTARGETVRGRFVAAADGLGSHLRRDAGLARASRAPLRFGVTRHFRVAAPQPNADRVEVIFGDRAEAYLTPLADDELGVALLWSGGKGGFDELVAERFPGEVAGRFAGLPRLGRDRGAGPFRQLVRRRTRGALALVGDAGGYVDALTGEGLSLGFEQAEALAAAVARGDLAGYERAARKLAVLPERLTLGALALARRPRLLRRYVAVLGRDPQLFSALLGALGARRPLAPAAAIALLSRLFFFPSARWPKFAR